MSQPLLSTNPSPTSQSLPVIMAERQKPPCGREIRAPPLVSGHPAASLLPSQSTAGAARARGAPPAAKPSRPTSRRSPFTSSPAATSCAAPAWPRSRKPRPWRAGAASARWPRRTSGGFTSNPPGRARQRGAAAAPRKDDGLWRACAQPGIAERIWGSSCSQNCRWGGVRAARRG